MRAELATVEARALQQALERAAGSSATEVESLRVRGRGGRARGDQRLPQPWCTQQRPCPAPPRTALRGALLHAPPCSPAHPTHSARRPHACPHTTHTERAGRQREHSG